VVSGRGGSRGLGAAESDIDFAATNRRRPHFIAYQT